MAEKKIRNPKVNISRDLESEPNADEKKGPEPSRIHTPQLEEVQEEDGQDDWSLHSSTSFSERRWFAMQSKTEMNAPRLLQATAAQYKIFLPAFRKYKEDDKGIQTMVELIAGKARTGICVFLNYQCQNFKICQTMNVNHY